MILTALNGNTIVGPASILRELAQHMAERGITYTIEGDQADALAGPCDGCGAEAGEECRFACLSKVADDDFDKMDDEYRASLSPEQLVEYRKFNGELMDCAECKLANVAVVGGESHPDYVGTVDISILACGCQVVVSDGAEMVR